MVRKLGLLIVLILCSTYTFAQDQSDLQAVRLQVEETAERMYDLFDQPGVTLDDIAAEQEVWEADVDALFVYLEKIESSLDERCGAMKEAMTGRVVALEAQISESQQICANKIELEKGPLLASIQQLEYEKRVLEESIPRRINEERVILGKKMQGLQNQLQEQQRMLYAQMKDEQTPLEAHIDALEEDNDSLQEEYAEQIAHNQTAYDEKITDLKRQLQEVNDRLLAKDNEIHVLKQKNKELAEEVE